jgi:hypothetical protein
VEPGPALGSKAGPQNHFEEPAGLAAVELAAGLAEVALAPDLVPFFELLLCFLVLFVVADLLDVEAAGVAEAAGLEALAGACAPNAGIMVATANPMVNSVVFIFSSPCGLFARSQFPSCAVGERFGIACAG